MKYDFDSIVDRKNTNCVKWDFEQEKLGKKYDDILPMWVADMDFEAPKPVIDEIIKRAQHGVYGYTDKKDSYYNSITDWMKKRHGWEVKKEWIVTTPGIVPALNWLVRGLTHPGDKVIIQSPVYPPFFSAVKNNGCHVVNNTLICKDNKYYMDFEDLESKIDSRVKLMIISNPHNPVGRVWTKEELTRLGEICLKNNIIVVSDEIHSDVIYKGYKHIPFASISEKFAQNSVVCTAPSKTFNIAGLQAANIIIPNEKIRNTYKIMMESNGIDRPNLFGLIGCEAAYKYGEEWLSQLLDYLEGNINFVMDFIKERIPQINAIRPEGTYLMWLDFRSLNMSNKELESFMLDTAGLWFNQGYTFGEAGNGFQRMNIGCSRKIIEKALLRIEKAMSQSI